jgi:glycyl-tRNA synthetase beta chain
VALADKLDTVVGLTAAGEKVTGSRDPFGLRRNAQGVIRTLLDAPELFGVQKEITLGPLVEQTRQVLGLSVDSERDYPAYLYERLASVLSQRGFPIEVVRAVTASTNASHAADWTKSPLRARRVADALQAMRTSTDFQALAVLLKRVKNIARERTDDRPMDRSALNEPAERALLDELDARRPRITAAIGAADYRRAFTEIAGLRPAVDRFFTEVFVMADDRRIRDARLALMAELRDLIMPLADISEIVPQTE